jgi:hypothetical protein
MFDDIAKTTFRIENDVHQWLTREGARFEWKKRLFDVAPLELDFLVLEPFPLVIQCTTLNQRMAGPFVRNDIVARRIAVAESLGPHVGHVP